MPLSKCAVCNSEVSRNIKEQEASGLLRQLGIRAPLTKIQLMDNILLSKMNNIINNFLLAGDRFMSEMHLRQPGFMSSALISKYNKETNIVNEYCCNMLLIFTVNIRGLFYH